MEAPHWIVEVMSCVSDDRWWDGVILGFTIGVLVVFIPWLWWTQ